MPQTELAISDESFCMEYVNGEYILKKDHAYYYQVQRQMFLTQAKACYFFVYSREPSLCQTILFDEVFLAEKVSVAKNFFVYATDVFMLRTLFMLRTCLKRCLCESVSVQFSVEYGRF